MVGIILFISLSFLIYVFFYKQSNPDYSLNQLEFEKIDKLHEILFEKNPIILHHVPPIPCVIPQTLLKTPRFAKILGDYLNQRESTLPLSEQFEIFMANETGFQTFGIHAWFNRFHSNPISEYISSIKSRLCFGSKKLQRTYALYNVIIPISGKYVCSLMNSEYESSLPNDWNTYDSIDSIVSTKKSINFIDIILKPGNLLILPSHWFYTMKQEEPYSYYGIFEYHEPISIFSEYLESRK
jgi:hypothetical protein